MNIEVIEAKREDHIEDFPVLVDFKYIFPEEIPGLPPKRDLDFSIELTPGLVPASKYLYYMSALELVEFKL